MAAARHNKTRVREMLIILLDTDAYGEFRSA